MDCSKKSSISELQQRLRHTSLDQTVARLIIVPDLTPNLVDVIGTALDINPMVFVSALRDVWDRDETEEMNPGNFFYDDNFGSTMFSYDTETIISATYLCYSKRNNNTGLEERLGSLATIDSIDKAFLDEISKRVSSMPAIKPVHPLLCPPLRKIHAGPVELNRSYQAINRITVHCIAETSAPTCESHVNSLKQVLMYRSFNPNRPFQRKDGQWAVFPRIR